MQTLLEHFLQREMLSGDNQYHCDVCGEKQDAALETSIAHAPPFLVLSLNRFCYDKYTHTRRKVATPVSLSRALVLPVHRGSRDGAFGWFGWFGLLGLVALWWRSEMGHTPVMKGSSKSAHVTRMPSPLSLFPPHCRCHYRVA